MIRSPKKRSVLSPCILALVLFPASSHAQDSAVFDAVASRVAEAVNKHSAKGLFTPKVMVADFVESKGEITQLGPYLSSQFLSAFTKAATDFTVVGSDGLKALLFKESLPPEYARNTPGIVCLADLSAAKMIVLGSYGIFDGSIRLSIELWQTWNDKKIFEDSLSIPLTSQMEDPAKVISAGQSPELRDFVRKPSTGVAPRAGGNGYGRPVCISYPQPTYTDFASKHKVQGTVLLEVEVTPDGLVKSITLIRGAGCGLSERAIETVSKWRLKPATGPDGQPAAVSTVVEVRFRLL